MIQITQKNYSEVVLKSKHPVLIDFYADWCGPCKMLSPILANIAEHHPEITVVKCDVDANQELAMKFGVRSIPTVVAMKGGVEVNRKVGLAGENILLALV
ncbi:MAG: thioredoxin [Erysipelotrichaceae bacterium]